MKPTQTYRVNTTAVGNAQPMPRFSSGDIPLQLVRLLPLQERTGLELCWLVCKRRTSPNGPFVAPSVLEVRKPVWFSRLTVSTQWWISLQVEAPNA